VYGAHASLGPRSTASRPSLVVAINGRAFWELRVTSSGEVPQRVSPLTDTGADMAERVGEGWTPRCVEYGHVEGPLVREPLRSPVEIDAGLFKSAGLQRGEPIERARRGQRRDDGAQKVGQRLIPDDVGPQRTSGVLDDGRQMLRLPGSDVGDAELLPEREIVLRQHEQREGLGQEIVLQQVLRVTGADPRSPAALRLGQLGPDVRAELLYVTHACWPEGGDRRPVSRRQATPYIDVTNETFERAAVAKRLAQPFGPQHGGDSVDLVLHALDRSLNLLDGGSERHRDCRGLQGQGTLGAHVHRGPVEVPGEAFGVAQERAEGSSASGDGSMLGSF